MAVKLHAVAMVTAFCAAAASASYGQEAPSAPADQKNANGLALHGSFDAGYRFRSLDGSYDTFRQLFDLSGGARLLGVDLHGEAVEGASAFADRFAVTASGLGGDPFPTIQASVSKARRYTLQVNWRRTRFFDVAPQTPDSIAGF